MNYKGKKIAITGYDGFIGTALVKALTAIGGVEVQFLKGDIRDRRTFDPLDHTFDYLFHFAAPSSQVLFKRQPTYCIKTTFIGFMNAADMAKRHGIRLVYPSTGLLSMGEANEYARVKKLCEDYAASKSMDAIGLRVFATYGPGEGHKRDYASVPYLFARDMAAGKTPEIYGDGEQVRDFIYIDDVVNAILVLAEECPDPVVDIGSGDQISFNDIIAEINAINDLPQIKPKYIRRPAGYVQETAADPKRLHDFYSPQVTFAEGITKLMHSFKEVK